MRPRLAFARRTAGELLHRLAFKVSPPPPELLQAASVLAAHLTAARVACEHAERMARIASQN